MSEEQVIETHALPIKSLDDTTFKSEWFLVGDMFNFENIGFTKYHNGNNNIKYLTCADCEMEAIGGLHGRSFILPSKW